MGFHRQFDGSEPLRPDALGRLGGTQEERRVIRSSQLATGTMACPACDVPVAPGPAPLSPADPVACPYCLHAAAVRDFLSLESPSRPAHVAVRVVRPGPGRMGR